MRVSPIVTLALLLPALAAAQEAGQIAPAGGEEGESYTVQPGDTLWDLSRRFLDDPYTWPRVWAENPAIANPHFIYPGNTVRLPGQRGQAGVGIPRELDDFSVADGQAIGEDDDVAVVGPYRIGYVAPRGLRVRRESFVTPQELEASAELHAAFEERVMLSVTDTAYARFAAAPGARPGQRYLIYKTERPLTHPVSGALLGYQTSVLGSGRVVAVEDRAVTVQIVEALEPIERGALLSPSSGPLLKQVQRRANARSLNGRIVGAREPILTELGQHHVVFVDLGSSDGVEEGNTFEVVRSGDPLGRHVKQPYRDPGFPDEELGTLLAIDVKEAVTTALVVSSETELFVGDEVVMRPPPATASAR